MLRLFLAYLTDVKRKKACHCGPLLHCDFRNYQWYMPVCLASETLSPNLLNNRYAYNKYCRNSNLEIHFTVFPTPTQECQFGVLTISVLWRMAQGSWLVLVEVVLCP